MDVRALLGIEHVVTILRNELQMLSDGTTKEFLDEFAPIHVEWHASRDFDGDPIGFLSFHHEVVEAYVALLRKHHEPVQKAMRKPKPPYRKHIDTLTDPESFSNALEDWHNSVHMNPIYPPDFMDPAKNVYMNLFWKFHTLIDDKFMAWIKKNHIKYEDVNHIVV